MKVTIAAHEWPAEGETTLRPAEVARIAGEAWDEWSVPGPRAVAVALGDGGPRTADSLDGPRRNIDRVEVVETTSGNLLVPAGGASRWNPAELASALRTLAATQGDVATARTVLVPLGDVPPAGDATELWGGNAAGLREALHPVSIVALVGSLRPLLGFHGMSAATVEGREADAALRAAAQEQEQRWADVARVADATASARMSLLNGARTSDAPGSGAAGGLAYCLAVAGAALRAGAPVAAELAGLREASASAQVLVAVVPRLRPSDLDHGPAWAVATEAGRRGVPCVVVAPDVQVGKRDLMAAGVASAHAAGVGEAALRDQIRRVAQTWNPRAPS